MKRKRLKRAEIRRRTQALTLVAVISSGLYLTFLSQGVMDGTPPFIIVSLVLSAFFVFIGGVVSLRWLAIGAFITLFSAVAVAFMFGTALGFYAPVFYALLGAWFYSAPQLTLGLVQLDLAHRAALPPDEHGCTPDVDRLTLHDTAESTSAAQEAPPATRGQRLQAALAR
ncbi:MAG: hypothetical protein SNJ54_13985 [Anaerolineae bacterium]